MPAHASAVNDFCTVITTLNKIGRLQDARTYTMHQVTTARYKAEKILTISYKK